MEINTRKVRRISPDGEIKDYNSVKSAAEDNNVYAGQIARGVKEGKTVKGYTYEYLEEFKKGKVVNMQMPVNPDAARAKRIFARQPYYMGKGV